MLLAERILSKTPAPTAGRRAMAAKVSVVGYHGVPDSSALATQLRSVAKTHSFISPDQLRAAFDGESLPPNPLLVTFDDGDRTVLTNGAPVLADFGIAPLLFVCGGLLDSDQPFWWDEALALAPGGFDEMVSLKTVPDADRRQRLAELRSGADPVIGNQLTTADLKELIEAGFEIGNHTFDHPCLDQVEDTDIVRQIEGCHEALVARGITPTAFAYPNGNLDTRTEPVLKRLGYDLGFLFDHHHLDLSQPRYRLSRLRLDADASPDRATLVLSGVHGRLMRMLRRG